MQTIQVYVDSKTIWDEFRFDCTADSFISLTHNVDTDKLVICTKYNDAYVYDLYDEEYQWLDNTADILIAIKHVGCIL